jgi:4-hydroxy-tetrahydrodipicolinate synthase
MDIYAIGSPFVPYVKEACRQKGHIACSKATFPLPELGEEARAKVRAFLEREGLL